MPRDFRLRHRLPQFPLAALLAWVVALLSSQSIWAQDREYDDVVTYNPSLVNVQGQLPVTKVYAVAITAPQNMLSPVAGSTADVSLLVEPTVFPAGVDPAVAQGYVTLSSNTLGFSSPGDQQEVTITIALPREAVAGRYDYRIYTDGWPLDAGTVLDNQGTYINSTVTAAPVVVPPPAPVITVPADGASIVAAQLPVTVNFNYTVPAPAEGVVIDSVTEFLDGSPDSITIISKLGENTADGVVFTGTMSISTAGEHTVEVNAHSPEGGTGSATSTFTILLAGTTPTIAITAPADGQVFAYDVSEARPEIPFAFTATSVDSDITSYSATLNSDDIGVLVSGLGSLSLGGHVNDLANVVSGTNTIVVQATNTAGTATKTSNFKVNPILVTITAPAAGGAVQLPPGAKSGDVSFAFTTVSGSSFTVSSVSAQLDDEAVAVAIPGTGGPSASSSGVLDDVTIGEHTLSATGVSSGMPITRTITFRVVGTPVIQWATPASIVAGTPLSGAQLNASAELDDGTVVPGILVYSAGDDIIAAGALLPAGAHTLNVTFVPDEPDFYNEATSSVTLIVEQPTAVTITGLVYFDANVNHELDFGDTGVAGVSVELRDSTNTVLSGITSDADGAYAFTVAPGGTYFVVVAPPNGFTPSTPTELTVTAVGTPATLETGLALNFSAIGSLTANGNTIGYWKNNLEKAISGKPKGAQETFADMWEYTDTIREFALAPFSDFVAAASTSTTAMAQAAAVFSGKGSTPAVLLRRQLLGSEYNFARGSYLGGNEQLTALFIHWGEYVLANADSYDDSYVIWAKDWFDAYNNSHGGVVGGPRL